MVSNNQAIILNFIYTYFTIQLFVPFQYKNSKLLYTNKCKFCNLYKYISILLNLSTIVLNSYECYQYLLRRNFVLGVIHGIVVPPAVAIITIKLSLIIYGLEFSELAIQLPKLHDELVFKYLNGNSRNIVSKLQEFYFIGAICVLMSTGFGLFSLNQFMMYQYPYAITTVIGTGLVYYLIFTIRNFLVYTESLVIGVVALPIILVLLSTMKFWIGFATRTRSNVFQSIQIYNNIYLCNVLFNYAFGRFTIPLLKVLSSWFLMVSVPGLILYKKDLPPIAILIGFIVAWGEVVSMLTILIQMSSLFGKSKEFLRQCSLEIKKTLKGNNRKYAETKLNACQLIRCRVGSFYFMQSRSKLKTVTTTVRGIVYLLTMFRKKA